MHHEATSLDALKDQFFAHLRAANRSESTITHYDDSFKDLRRYCVAKGLAPTLDSITTQTVQEYATWLRETPTKVWRGKTERSVFGISGRLRDLKAFLGYLERYQDFNRRVRVPSLKLPQPEFDTFSQDELVQIFRAPHLAAKGDQPIRNRAIVAVLLDTGVRLAEIANLKIMDVELPDQLIRVTGKGQKTRRVPFSNDTAAYLRDWLKVRGVDPGIFFGLSYHGIRMMLSRVQSETGIHIDPHRFRHTAASTLVRNGVDVASVRRILGHSSISTTLLYVHQSAEDLRAKHNAASPLEGVTALLGQSVTPKRRRLTVE